MKKICSLFLILIMIAAATACSQQSGPAETPASAQAETQKTPEPTEAHTPSSSPTPEPKPFVPEELFGSPFNPFHDAAFPDNFNVYCASFDIGVEKLGGKPHYLLSMTAEGKTDESVIFLAKLAGIEDAQIVGRHAEDFKNGGFCEFQSADGIKTFTIKKTDRNDDRYEYVEGLHADISVNLTDAEAALFLSLVRDNFNINALAVAADYFDVAPAFEEYGIAMNRHKQQVSTDMRYTVTDVAAIQKSMAEKVKSDWYDAQSGKMGLSYGIFDIGLLFDGKGGYIYVSETTSDMKSVLSAYVEPEVSFAKLGFGFDDAGTCGVYEQREPHYMSVAIHRPEWGEWNSDWNIEYMDVVNGYTMLMWYYTDEGKWHIAIEGDNGGSYDYYPATGKHDGHPENVPQVFNAVFGTQGDDFYGKPLAYFEQVVQERFGMSVDELYALPIR